MNVSPSSSTNAERVQPDRATIDASTVDAPLVLQLIPSVHAQKYGRYPEEPAQLVSAMQSLVIDPKHPVALEISGTHQERRLLLRAKDPAGLKHAETQLRARLPQVSFLPCGPLDDPFILRPGETVSTIELIPGRASYLPLHSFDRHHLSSEDPILGLFGALDKLPDDLRAITQIALEPASPTWSDAYQRKAVEHALEPERQKDRRQTMLLRQNSGGPPGKLIILGAMALVGFLLIQYQPNLVPPWLYRVATQLLQGQWHQVWIGPHRFTLVAGVGLLMLIVLCTAWLHRFVSQMRTPPLYDMRSVAEKTSRNAYRVRIRCYVIGSAGRSSSLKANFAIQRYWKPLPGLVFLTTGWAFLHHRQWKSLSIWLVSCLLILLAFLWYGPHVLIRWIGTTNYNCWQRVNSMRSEQTRRHQQLARLIAAYRQYHQANGNFFQARRLSTRRAQGWIEYKTWWRGIHHSAHLIDVETLAALWHLPTDDAVVNLAQVTYQRSQTRLIPPSLITAQGTAEGIGFSVHAGHTLSFRFPENCLRSHMLIGGKSGEGKSTLMTHLAAHTMRQQQHGLVLIDPHGDLADDVLRLVPASRLDDTLYIDLSEENFAWGINPLDATMSKGRDKAIADLIKILSHIWASSWGPRMEIACEYALRTLYEANKILCLQGEEKKHQQYTLLDVMALLTDESFCHSLLESITDPFITRWWARYYDPLSMQMQRDRVDPVLSKVAKFESHIARHIMGQSCTTLDLTECVKQNKIVLVKLAKGMVGEDIARILGATIFGLLQIALEEQGNAPLQQRQQVAIFLDEFQTLEGVDWGVLAELRKYGATFFLATQSLEYLRAKQMLPVVISNVKQLAIFRMSSEDAEFLARELAVEPDDIVNLESLTCYLKLLYEHRQQATFSLQLALPQTSNLDHAERIRQLCRQRYMRATTHIDSELFEHLARQIAAIPLTPPPVLPHEQRSQEKKSGLARQDGGNRGRKGQQSMHSQRATKEGGVRVHPLNWTEIVGPVPDAPVEEEKLETPQEVDPHEYT